MNTYDDLDRALRACEVPRSVVENVIRSMHGKDPFDFALPELQTIQAIRHNNPILIRAPSARGRLPIGIPLSPIRIGRLLVPIEGFNNANTGLAGEGFRRPQAQVSGGGGNDANTILLCHCDGADGGTTFTDSSSLARTMTANGLITTSTVQSKFGGASSLASISTDFVSSPVTADVQFAIADPFTADLWFRASTFPGALITVGIVGTDAPKRWALRVTNAAKLAFYNGINVAVTSAATISADTWTHIAASKPSSGLVTLFVNGVADNTWSQLNAFGVSGGTNIVFSANVAMVRYIDEVRISKVDRYGGVSFTPPTSAYS